MKCPCGGELLGCARMDGMEIFKENDGEMVCDETLIENYTDFWVDCDNTECPHIVDTIFGKEHSLFSFDGEKFIQKS